MSLKDLFKNKKFLRPTSKDDISKDIESSDLIESYRKDKHTFIPDIDFSRPENFARYGSAEKYYTEAFTRITDQFPYDGSRNEKTEWFVSSSYIDKWIYDNKYPRVNGYVNFSPNGWGSRVSSHAGSGYTLGMPSNKEYILIKGGPNKDPDKDYKKEGSKSNIYDLDKNRTTNLRLNSASGSTVEFWLKVDALPDTGNDGVTDRMTVFDLWNGVSGSSSGYGRFEIYVNNDGTGSNAAFGIHAVSGTAGPEVPTDVSYVGFNAASASATNEGLFTGYTQTSLADSAWHHYAFVLKNTGSNLISQLFVDGEKKQTITKSSETLNEIEGKMLATIGANVAYPDFIQDPGTADSANGRGLSKFSGSMDEFRYWKTARTEKEIGRHWFTQVNGGTNKDDYNLDLGVYYKFNEGIIGTSSTDATVLDYSGRISNGEWYIESGMTGSVYRSTDSAIVLSSASTKEFKDPIIYSGHSDVKSIKEELELSGSDWDSSNTSLLYNSIPDWITENDATAGDNHLRNLTQIMSSYFDTLHLQMEALPRLKDNSYHSSSAKPYFFNERVLQNFGFDTAELFYDEDLLENFDDRDKNILFREKLHNVKNIIYSNIYNNLIYINKSKGTEKSFRNLIRCFGIDEEFIRLNMYANNASYTLKDSYREASFNKSFANFSSASDDGLLETRAATVYQDLESGNSNSTSYVWASDSATGDDIYTTTTTEAEILFPNQKSARSKYFVSFPSLSSSLFGCHTAEEDTGDLKFSSRDYGYQVYAVRKERNGSDAYFHLEGDELPDINSEVFEDVYDNEKWNFAVRLRLEKEPWSNLVTGTTQPDTSSNNLIIEFSGFNTEAGVVKRSFTASAATGSLPIVNSRKRFYVGANRTDFSGSLIASSDVKVGTLRHWVNNITDDEIKSHALDAQNYGTENPLRSGYLFETTTLGMEIPKLETLALHWDFSNVTSSDASGQFLVPDVSSGSATDNKYGWVGNIVNKQHPGKGYGFPANNSAVITKTYIPTLKQTIPENLLSSDMVKVLAFDDEIFTRETRPVNYFFAFEKSPYQNISEEMLNVFSTIKDFNNLIGEPVNRYRQKYKDMEKLRQLFFERVENTPDIDKYIDFYKWIDSSMSTMLNNLVPASANFAEGVRTVIESHILERNKYWTKFPTMEFKFQDPEGSIKGISELNYNWKFGHAPLPDTAATATIVGLSTLNGEDGTNLILTNADGSTVTFHTDPTKNFGDTSSDGGDHIWEVNTRDISGGSERRKATQALYIACKTAIDAGELDMTINPATVAPIASGQLFFTLTQTTLGDSGNTTITLITGMTADGATAFAGGSTPQNQNCLWWKERAERVSQAHDIDGAPTSGDVNVDSNRDDILQVLVTQTTASNPKLAQEGGTTYQGSSYAMRSLTRPYKFKAEVVTTNHSSIENKKNTLWKTELELGSAKMVTINSSSLTKDPSHQCNDELTPKELKKHKYNFKITTTGQDEYLQGYGELLAPFSIYSSSVRSGYNLSLSQFSDEIQINNLHVDSYFGEEPMQGPFTEKYVGGHQYRHANLNTATGKELDIRNPDLSLGTKPRPEGYYLEVLTNVLRLRHSSVDPSTSGIDPRHPTAKYYRDEVAKRPVNIRNIRQGTGSIEGGATVIGNYEHNYQVVQIPGRNVNNLWFRSGSTGAGGVDESHKESEWVSGTVDFRLPDRSKLSDESRNKTVIAERFSSPGGPECMSRGFLDVETETYSIYNTINYRNSIVRNFVDSYSSKRCEQFGLLSGTTADPESDLGPASWHKVNRNPSYSLRLDDVSSYTDDDNIALTASSYDNAFVTHMIPQSDRQYAWITASISDRSLDSIGKSAPFGYSMTQDGMTYNSIDGWHNPFTWVTSSEVGSAEIPDFSDARYFGARRAAHSASIFPDIDTRAATDSSLMTTDFAGLNTNIYEPLTESSNTLGYENLSMLDGSGASSIQQVNYINQTLVGDDDADETTQPFGIASVLNSLLLNRNGPGGYPIWKQVRTERHPVARHMRRNNRYSFIKTGKKRGSYYSWSYDLFSKGRGQQQLESTKGTAERVLTSSIEPPVSFRNKPMVHKLSVDSPSGPGDITIKHAYGNNIESFANQLLNIKVPTPSPEKQTYNELVNLYTPAGNIPFEFNPIKKMHSFTYSETIFPRNIYTGLNKVRSRQNYAETTNNVGGNGIDRKERRTFWRDKRSDRGLTINLAENSQGYVDRGQGRPVITGTQLNVWPLGPVNHGPTYELDGADTHPWNQRLFRKTFFGELWPSGTYESVLTTPSLSFMRSLAAPSTGSSDVTDSNLWYSSSVGITKLPLYSAHTGREVRGRNNSIVSEPRNPWYDSYDDYSQDIRIIAKDYSILPEFKISDHIDYYVNTGGNYLTTNNKILSLPGASFSSSADDERSSADKDFYETYSHSDFLSSFSTIRQDHSDTLNDTSHISLTCRGIKKLLPYNGFYPALRSVQLGSLLSQSLGPYIGGSESTGSRHYTPTPNDNAQRLNSLLQPFLAPGIFFNSIKSGIAVDYPIFKDDPGGILAALATTAGLPHVALQESPSYRLPFEALVNMRSFLPTASNIYYTDPQFTRTQERTDLDLLDPGLQIYFTWSGKSDPKFEMANHNFLGETVKFFLKDEKLKTFKSKPEKDFKSMISGNTYYMDIALNKTDDFVLSQGGLYGKWPGDDTDTYSLEQRGAIYGPPYRSVNDTGTSDNAMAFTRDPMYAPHTPPYFYGVSTARIEFKPHEAREMASGESGLFSLQEIFSNSNTTFFNDNPQLNRRDAALGAGIFSASLDMDSLAPSLEACMELSSSINLFGISRGKDVTYSATQTGLEESGIFTPISVSNTGPELDSWVISPKWECPALNVTASSDDCLSIWNRYGLTPSGSSGIFFEIKESYPEEINNRTINSLTQSLIEVCGFEPSSQRIGELAEEKEISEAVIAIPYSVAKIPGQTVNIFGNKHFFKIEKQVFKTQKANIDAGKPAIISGQLGSSKDIEHTSVSNMIRAMRKYVFPPKFNFLRKTTGNTPTPFAMYIFEFTHNLDRQELSDIWQNLMPDIAVTAEKQDVVISHDVSKYDFFGSKAGPFNLKTTLPHIRWMIFKVKKKAEGSYYNITADTTDDDKFKFDFGGSSVLTSTSFKKPDYTYNWPYDFFSLVELTKIESSITIKPTSPPLATDAAATMALLGALTTEETE